MIRSAVTCVSALAAIVWCGSAESQLPGDLAAKKEFTALRSSSTDPNLHNGDSRRIAAGDTLTVADIKGQGSITHLWFTIAAPSEDHLRELVLRDLLG